MRIGIPKEISLEEKRVSLTPAAVDELVKNGHVVYVESNAGIDCHFLDEDYRAVGANIVYSLEEIYKRSEMIVKVTPITEEESKMLLPEQILFSFMYMMMSKKNTLEILLNKKITAIGYELIERETEYSILHSMSDIAGQLAIQVAEKYLENSLPVSRGVLLGGIPGVNPAKVVIIGAGVAGMSAARSAFARGADVVLLDKNISKLKQADILFKKAVRTLLSTSLTVSETINNADVVIGAVSSTREKAPIVLSKKDLKYLPKGSVLVDLAIDRGGCFESSRPTSISNPIFVEKDIIHFCVPNLPSIVSRTASIALTNNILDYIVAVANNGLNEELMSDQSLQKGVCMYEGFCTDETISKHFGLDFRRLHIYSQN